MSLINLPWLPAAPDSFRARCKSATAENLDEVRYLASHALDLNQLNSLAKTLKRIRAEDHVLDRLEPLKLGILSNSTTALLAPALAASAARHGLILDVIEAPFDQAMQAAQDPGSEINKAKPDLVLLAFDQRIIAKPSRMFSESDANDVVNQAMEYMNAVCAGIRENSGASLIVQTLPHPPAHMLGSFDRRLPASPYALIDRFNSLLLQALDGSGDTLLDIGGLAATVGLDIWHNALQWNVAKLSFAQEAVPLYADHVARLLGAIRGKSRKCLVLDLDNTLWGGVIGDDGLEGIVLGQGDPAGEAYLDIQRTALNLRQLGVILAVSSKNNDPVARRPFQEHPDMLIKEQDIAVFQANWSDKASNLEAIAKALDIGLDSLVLLDDNPAERAQVREALPQVAVPELPEDPALFARTLLAAGYFETIALSDEDRIRADDYSARASRIELQSTSRNLESFLASLDMEISFSSFDEAGQGRIAQLINKSNQFNLTTRRYTEVEVASMRDDNTLFTLQVRLRDRFGDNGMISVIICRPVDHIWEIDTWLMSCRVLGRRVEEAVLAEVVRNARKAGIQALRGRYRPTDRNQLVVDHYKNLGFESAETDEEDRLWHLDLENFQSKDIPMKIIELVSGGLE